MTTLPDDIGRILAHGQRAATGLDAGDLEHCLAELLAWQQSDEARELDAEQLTQARTEIIRFRDLCRFLHDTIGRALFGDESYVGSGETQTTERPMLVEKYG